MSIIQSRRSFLFSPGTNPSMFGKALKSGADIVCVELEDGVAPQHKDMARANMLAIFAEPQDDDGVERIVRVNMLGSPEGEADLAAVLETETPTAPPMPAKGEDPGKAPRQPAHPNSRPQTTTAAVAAGGTHTRMHAHAHTHAHTRTRCTRGSAPTSLAMPHTTSPAVLNRVCNYRRGGGRAAV